MHASPLDEAVSRAQAVLRRRGVPLPAALLHLATGVGVLAGRLKAAGRLPFSSVEACPRAWRESLLHWGELEGVPVWLLEAAPLEPEESDAAWEQCFPIWLAAASGASTLLYVTAGAALDASIRAGTLALLGDHINFSGSTPLLGLGASKLGAQFPDQTRVHDVELRRAALTLAGELGLAAREVVAAGTLGPTLETPAERRWLARAGAEVSAQGLAAPLIAAAHAGLGGLTIVVVVQQADEALDIAKIAARSEALAPALDDLLTRLSAEVQRRARAELEDA